MAGTLYTVGYQGRSLDELLALLQNAGVSTLVDVRELPWSRRPEFTKKRIEAALTAGGIAYVHLKALGSPKAARDAAKAGRRGEWLALTSANIDGPAGQAALDEAETLARAAPACLMCMEADPAECHRTLVAERLHARAGFTIEHLGAPKPRQGDLLDPTRAR